MSKLPTIKDVAEHAGVSFKTVSRVVNGLTTVNPEISARVKKSIAALGYQPNLGARQMRSEKTWTIVLLVGSSGDVDSLDQAHRMPSYVNDVMTGMLKACRVADHHLVIDAIESTDERIGRSALKRFLDQIRPDGMLLMPPLCDMEWIIDDLEARRIPVARLNTGTQLERSFCIGIDNYAAAGEVAELLLDLGHRNVGYITGPESHRAVANRLDGFRAGLNMSPTATLSVRRGDFLFESGRNQAASLLDGPEPPTAIFAGNDEMAAGVLAAAVERGLRIPADLSIVGFGGLVVSEQTWPRLTTVSQPTIEMARRATEALIVASTDKAGMVSQNIVMPHRLEVRQSTAPCT